MRIIIMIISVTVLPLKVWINLKKKLDKQEKKQYNHSGIYFLQLLKTIKWQQINGFSFGKM